MTHTGDCSKYIHNSTIICLLSNNKIPDYNYLYYIYVKTGYNIIINRIILCRYTISHSHLSIIEDSSTIQQTTAKVQIAKS